jgi:hypothetical protein
MCGSRASQVVATVRGGYYLRGAGPERFEMAPFVEPHDRVIAGHSAAGYSLSDFAAASARKENPAAMHAIFVLREPVARAVSDFKFLFTASTWRGVDVDAALAATLAHARRCLSDGAAALAGFSEDTAAASGGGGGSKGRFEKVAAGSEYRPSRGEAGVSAYFRCVRGGAPHGVQALYSRCVADCPPPPGGGSGVDASCTAACGRVVREARARDNGGDRRRRLQAMAKTATIEDARGANSSASSANTAGRGVDGDESLDTADNVDGQSDRGQRRHLRRLQTTTDPTTNARLLAAAETQLFRIVMRGRDNIGCKPGCVSFAPSGWPRHLFLVTSDDTSHDDEVF